jgi:hypothetical protein
LLKTLRKSAIGLLAAFTVLALHAFSFPHAIGMAKPDPETESLDSVLSPNLADAFGNLIRKKNTQFSRLADSLYQELCSDEGKPAKVVFEKGLKGYLYLLINGKLGNPNFLSLIDYSLSANKKRMWVIDMRTLDVAFTELVSHGRNTGEEYARYFSNQHQSFKTSLGFFLTGENYEGSNGLSLRLYGIERNINNHAFDRAIVMHGADYVSPEFIRDNKRLGRSLGCPAVGVDVISPIVNAIENGSCIFAYYPQTRYLRSSPVLNASLAVPLG